MEEKPSLLPRLSVTRPVTVTMCLVALLVVGAMAYTRISVQLFPSGFMPRFLWMRIGYPGATPQEVEQQIARPLEETLRTVKGIEQIRTYSGTWGVGAPLRFRQDADMELAYNQVMDRLERLKPQLPEEARDKTFVWKRNEEGDAEIMWVGVAIDSSIVDPYRFLETHVQRPLERIDGVAKVDFWGVNEKEVMVEVDQERLRSRGVNTYELVQALRSDNFAIAGGYVHEDGKRFYVRSVAKYRTLEEIGNIPIRGRNGQVRLKEVADVVYDVSPARWGYQRIDGRMAASLEVKRESGGNIVAICDRVVEALERIEAQPATAGLAFNVFFNDGQFIRQSIRNLQNTALWGGFFAAMVLLFFLRTVRMTAIITLAIPLCVMITMMVLYFVDWSLNMVTMMGLMVGVGMVVDNAIVILENIYRMREKGEAPREASIRGASEVALAIIMATLTTVVVFLPLMLMGRNAWMAFQLSRIGVPVMIMLVGSLFVALLFIPLAGVRFGGHRVKQDPKSIGWARRVYGQALGWTLRHRRDTLLIVLAVFATILYPSGKLKRTDSARGNINDIHIRVYPPRNFSMLETYDVLMEMEDFLNTKREAYGIRTIRLWFRRTYGRFTIFLKANPDEAWWYVAYKDLQAKLGYPVDARMDRKAVIKDLKKHVPKFVGVRVGVQSRGRGSGDPSVSIYLYGNDTEVLAGMTEEVERRLRAIPSVISVDTDLERANDEVQVRIDRERAQRYGISPQLVGRSLAYGLGGVNLPPYQSGEREVRTRLYLEKVDRQTLHQLKNFSFRSRSGEEIPLAEFASLTVAKGSGTIRREDGKTRLRVFAFTTKDDLKGLYGEIDQAMEGFAMPRGYSWNKGERYAKFKESDNEMGFALAMAIVSVFLLMGVLFESFVLPFSVLFSIPFAFLGVYWTLFLTNTPFDMMATIGLIVLIGVVVNNAIVLVDMVNRLRADGMDRTEAIREAGHNRFRPILMTTFTTVFGLLPMSIGNSNLIGIPYAPLGRTMMGGLLCSTFLTLFVVPLFYTYLDDLRMILRRIIVAVFSRSEAVSYRGAQADG